MKTTGKYNHKRYVCVYCGVEHEVGTNHYGEIYSYDSWQGNPRVHPAGGIARLLFFKVSLKKIMFLRIILYNNMNLIRTVSVKLQPSQEERQVLLETVEAYTEAYNTCCSYGYENKINNRIKLHHALYHSMRPKLPSQLAISVLGKATAALKPALKRRAISALKKTSKRISKAPSSKRQSILLDQNSYTIWLNRNEVSILTCKGRIKLPISFNKHSKQFLTWKYCSASLIFRKNKFFLNIQFKKDIEDIPPNGTFVGIDRGIKKIAVTSNNQFFLGGETRRVSQRYERLRSGLQKSGSQSAKRHLVRVSGREKRFKADVNHVISKKIIDSMNPGDTIVLEDLCGIRNKRLRKKQRKNIHKWSYYQLEQFLIYKGEGAGINVVYVDARYTSLRCSKCGHIKRSNRKSQSKFRCGICGFTLNADLNAARNIKLKYLEAQRASGRADVNQPIASSRDEKSSRARSKPTGSSRG